MPDALSLERSRAHHAEGSEGRVDATGPSSAEVTRGLLSDNDGLDMFAPSCPACKCILPRRYPRGSDGTLGTVMHCYVTLRAADTDGEGVFLGGDEGVHA